MKIKQVLYALPFLSLSIHSMGQDLTTYDNIYLKPGTSKRISTQTTSGSSGTSLVIQPGNATGSLNTVSPGTVSIYPGTTYDPGTGGTYYGTLNLGDRGYVNIGDNATTALGKGSGRVAIGSYTIPGTFKFYVNGNSFFNGNLGLGTSNIPTGSKLTLGSNTGRMSFYGGSNGEIVSTGSFRPYYSSTGNFSINQGDLTSSTPRFTILSNGTTYLSPAGGGVVVGNNTVQPAATFDVRGSLNAAFDITMVGTELIDPARRSYIDLAAHPDSRKQRAIVHGWGDDLLLNFAGDFEGGIKVMGPGLLIGTGCIPTGYKLAVDGKIRARGLQLNVSNWCDYVFADDYKLRPLSEVEQFIKENKHLPEIPSEKEAIANGIDVSEMNALLLKKVEELTLYSSQLEKEISALNEKQNAATSNEELARQLQLLVKEVEALKQDQESKNKLNK